MDERRNGRIAEVLRLDPIERISLVLSLGTCGAALAFASPRFAEAVAIGAVIEAFNLRVLVRAARSFLASNAEAGAGGWISAFIFRIGLTTVALWVAIRHGTDPRGILVGLLVAVPAVLLWAWRERVEVDPALARTGLAADDPSWDQWSVWLAREVVPAEDDEEGEEEEEDKRP